MKHLCPAAVKYLLVVFFQSPIVICGFVFSFVPITPSAKHQFRRPSALYVINEPITANRRAFLSSIGWAAISLPASATDSSVLSSLLSTQTQAESSLLQSGLLESRVTENVLAPPSYGMEGPDIFYPLWFAGTWNVESIFTNVSAPCGIALFGGNATMDAAKKELGPAVALHYNARFLEFDGRAIADREYNVKSIAKVTLGQNSVVDVSLSTPNKFSCLLSPEGSPTLLTADLIVLNRRQENVDETHFDCSEVVREIVSAVGEGSTRPRSPLLKEIETCSLYSAVIPQNGGPITHVKCRQRSAAFLLPSQDDPIAMKMFEYSRGRPVDVRFYDVLYTKI